MSNTAPDVGATELGASKADIRQPDWHVRFVPILLQKAVEGFLGQ